MSLGGNVRLVISGAAPLPVHVEDFLRVVTCAPVVQGYGMISPIFCSLCGSMARSIP
jgi:long-subunit acyl-CoA synthetase (AMP-forming)